MASQTLEASKTTSTGLDAWWDARVTTRQDASSPAASASSSAESGSNGTVASKQAKPMSCGGTCHRHDRHLNFDTKRASPGSQGSAKKTARN